MSNAKNKTQDLPQGPLRLLLGLAVTESLLSLFQWVELVILRHGGNTVCGINDTFNCNKVWNSQLASAIHNTVGIPVAGLGLVWGLAATFLCALVLTRKGKAQAQLTPALLPALRLLGAVGAVTCVSLGIASTLMSSYCLMCLGTYAIVLAFAGVALVKLPGPLLPSGEQAPRALLWTFAPVFGAYLVALVPGLMTPHADAEEGQAAKLVQTQGQASANPLADFVNKLTPMEAQALSDTLQAFRNGPTATPLPPRVLKGSKDAPVRIVEFTDIRCGHCRALVENMNALEAAVPPGSFSVDARHFPLDSDCNPLIPSSDKLGIRCAGAKAQICLEGAPDYWQLRDKLFSEQERLTPERIVEIASSGSMNQAELEACMNSPETTRKLQEDVQYANQVHPRGTPIVIVNGRSAPPSPGFLYALILAKGDLNAPEFAKLPPPGMAGTEGE